MVNQEKKEFKYMTLPQVLIILVWFVTHTILSFSPNLLPFEQLGQLGNQFSHLASKYQNGVKNVYLVLMVIHVLEALWAWKLSRDLQFNTSEQMKWFLQTLYGGLFSLGHLFKMKAATRKQE